jgi:hypothetical protein
MTRLLALLLFALLIGLAARQLLLRARRSPIGQLVASIWRSGVARDAAAVAPGAPDASVTVLVPCGGCGVHVPVDRTVRGNGSRLCERCAGGPGG